MKVFTASRVTQGIIHKRQLNRTDLNLIRATKTCRRITIGEKISKITENFKIIKQRTRIEDRRFHSNQSKAPIHRRKIRRIEQLATHLKIDLVSIRVDKNK